MQNMVSLGQSSLFMHDKKFCGYHEHQAQSTWEDEGRQA
jgi:hypothetical protein